MIRACISSLVVVPRQPCVTALIAVALVAPVAAQGISGTITRVDGADTFVLLGEMKRRYTVQ